MSTQPTDPPQDPPVDPPVEPQDPPTDPPADSTDWKAEARKHEDRAKANAAAAKELAELKAAQQTDAERLAAERDSALDRATKATERAATSDAKGLVRDRKFRDSSDALSAVPVRDYLTEDGELDEKAYGKALDDLAKAKPYLLDTAAPPRSGGEVKGGTTAGQLTRADLKGMAPKDIEAARKAGRLDTVLGVTR